MAKEKIAVSKEQYDKLSKDLEKFLLEWFKFSISCEGAESFRRRMRRQVFENHFEIKPASADGCGVARED